MKLLMLYEGMRALKLSPEAIEFADSIYDQISSYLEAMKLRVSYSGRRWGNTIAPKGGPKLIKIMDRSITRYKEPGKIRIAVFCFFGSPGDTYRGCEIDYSDVTGLANNVSGLTKIWYGDKATITLWVPYTHPKYLKYTDLKATILHEVSHCLDPGNLIASGDKATRTAQRALPHETANPFDVTRGSHEEYNKYVNDPLEKTAEIGALAISIVKKAISMGLSGPRIINKVKQQTNTGSPADFIRGFSDLRCVNTYLKSPDTMKSLQKAIIHYAHELQPRSPALERFRPVEEVEDN